MDKTKFVTDLIDNFDVIKSEYLENASKRTIAIPGYDENSTPLQEWRAVALWWDYKPWPLYQKWFPRTTELIRQGPSHRASGYLILKPNSRTPAHDHKPWGNKIITHLPVIVPEGDIGFVVEDKIHRWQEGQLFAFDVTKTHYGYNNTNQDRVIFVLDFEGEEWAEILRPYSHL